MQLALDLVVTEVLSNPNMDQLTSIVILPGVAQGTTSLTDYFKPGGQLELLTSVISMRERAMSGSRSDRDWLDMAPYVDLPTYGPQDYNGAYQFTGGDIRLPGANQALDLRVFGKFQTAPLVREDSALPPGLSPIIEFRTAAIIAGTRGNAAILSTCNTFSDRAQSAYVANVIMELQKVRTRMSGFSGRGIR